MDSYSTYLFDVGGTLILFDASRRSEAYVERAAQVGVHFTQQEAQSVLERLDQEIPEGTRHLQLSLMPPAEQRAFWTEFWAEGFRRLGVEDATARVYADELLDPVNGGNLQAVYPDVRPTLEGLEARGRRLGIISNFSPNCQDLLGQLGLERYFDFFIVSGILGIEKPDPAIFEAAVSASGLPRTRLVYIGDSIHHDVEGAQRAGIDAILIDRANLHPEFKGTRIRDLRELLRT
jgi:putative hydrolase of the HAD superfamily